MLDAGDHSRGSADPSLLGITSLALAVALVMLLVHLRSGHVPEATANNVFFPPSIVNVEADYRGSSTTGT